jgi:long-chain acyl-CoA synthetase
MEKIWLKKYPKGIRYDIDVSEYDTIPEIFDQACDRFATKTAYSNKLAFFEQTLTYAELDHLSTQFASFLQNECHLRKGDRIALQMPNILQFPIALAGALKAGLVVVNTNPLYTEREMKHQFRDAGAKAIVIAANFADKLEHIIGETDIDHVVVTQLGDMFAGFKGPVLNALLRYVKKMVPPFRLANSYTFHEALAIGENEPFRRVEIKRSDLAFLQYTGGTTGVSKGAMLTHDNVVSNMLQIREWICKDLRVGEEVIITPLPLYHIFSLTVNCLAFTVLGGHNVLITNPRDIPNFIKTLAKTRITVMTGVNTLFNALLNHPDFAELDLSAMKITVAGGMALQVPVAERWEKITRSRIAEGYGLTETSPVATCNPIDGSDIKGTIGLPLPLTEIKVIGEDGADLGFDQPGEICIRGPQVMQGYWQRPEETALVLSKDGWFRTGDVAVLRPDGFAKIVDRKKDMILVSGFNVYPNEVEEVISSHPRVAEVAAVGVPDEHSGEAVKVFVVRKDPALSIADVLAHCKQNLTSYKIPKYVEFRNELPKTNVGKILRRALRDEKAV